MHSPGGFFRAKGVSARTKMAVEDCDLNGDHGHPILTLGLVSDIQYADIDNRLSSSGSERFYRSVLNQLDEAATHWNGEKVDFVVHCGDVIDAVNHENATEEVAIGSVLKKLDKINAPVHHILGNHCLVCLKREQLRDFLQMKTPCSQQGYYSISHCTGWRFLMLDSSDVALYGRPKDHPYTKLAARILHQNNPNENKSDNIGLVGLPRRFVAWGGGVSSTQLEWMESELMAALHANQKVVVFSHIPVQVGLDSPTCLVWNYGDVLEMLHAYPNVKLVVNGHTHNMAHLRDAAGLHHVVLPGMVETPPGKKAFGCLHLYEDKMEVVGFNTMSPIVMPLDKTG